MLHHVPERHRAFRDRLRRVAGLLGYGALQPGVLIAVADRAADLDAALGEVPAGAEVRHARLALDAPDAACRGVARLGPARHSPPTCAPTTAPWPPPSPSPTTRRPPPRPSTGSRP